jgi:hypothetical protein
MLMEQARDVCLARRDFRPSHGSCAARTSLDVGGENAGEQPGPSFSRRWLIVALAELVEQVELIAGSGRGLGRGWVRWSTRRDEFAA